MQKSHIWENKETVERKALSDLKTNTHLGFVNPLCSEP